MRVWVSWVSYADRRELSLNRVGAGRAARGSSGRDGDWRLLWWHAPALCEGESATPARTEPQHRGEPHAGPMRPV